MLTNRFTRCHPLRFLIAAVFVAGFTVSAAGNVNLSNFSVDSAAAASSGSLSSLDFDAEDPAPTTAGSPAISVAEALAGPVAPVSGDNNRPGTTGVAMARSEATFGITFDGGFLVSLDNTGNFTNLDGGTVNLNTLTDFFVQFTVAENTPYQVTGNFNVSPNDTTWFLSLAGTGGFLLDNTTEPLDAGNIGETGVLQAGQNYVFSGQTSLFEQRVGDNGNLPPFDSDLQATLTFNPVTIPEPTTAAALAVGSLTFFRRRPRPHR
ncbi:MAG: PEP-CTERM sorting domain-containing protein [Planctomycetota bacterium]